MTIREAIRAAETALREHGIDDAAFDARCLAEDVLQMSRTKLLTNSDLQVSDEAAARLQTAAARRCTGEPLQYILGAWEFMGNRFAVGQGVLIPRPETELLVEFAVRHLQHTAAPVVFDLCAGSGCIGLSFARLRQDAEVWLIEKYDAAFRYLQKNAQAFALRHTHPVQADVLTVSTEDFPAADLILSNPPYVRRDELPALQREVQAEPITALDGGTDGLDFYRALTRWLCRLKPHGVMAMECGEDQAQAVAAIYEDRGCTAEILRDLYGAERVVIIRT